MALTKTDLRVIEFKLTDRDKEILRTLRNTKCLFTYQIRRVFFTDSVNTSASARATNRTLKRLKDLGLLDTLVDRRIGGVRAGSASYIWYLTEQGHRLLDLDVKYPGRLKRTRFSEPADSTLSHRLAVNECFVQLMEIEKESAGFKVKEVLFEPKNWQSFEYDHKPEILKPDLFTITSHNGYEYRFFIEIDLSSESIDTVLNKCIRYHRYLSSGIEQELHGVFPIVLFIVRDEKRRTKIEEAIRTHLYNHPSIFIVIRADEFVSLMKETELPTERLC